MLLPSPLISGRLIKRYQRFLADVELDDGSRITAHCPNSGSMKGCAIPGSPVLLSSSGNPSRRYPHTWELVWINCGWVGINTARPNLLVREGIEEGIVRELRGYSSIRPEVRYGDNSRIDLLLEKDAGSCFVEVKNVTLVEKERALFPDSVTTRGQKHLRELMREVEAGNRGVIFFVVQRGDAQAVSPADAIDPDYGRLLRQAVTRGVEALAYRALVTPEELRLVTPLPIIL